MYQAVPWRRCAAPGSVFISENPMPAVELGVKRQEVVSRAGESGHGCVTSDSLMGAMPIVVMDPALEHVGTLRGMVIRDAVGPFTKRRLDEALGLAVGLRPV